MVPVTARTGPWPKPPQGMYGVSYRARAPGSPVTVEKVAEHSHSAFTSLSLGRSFWSVPGNLLFGMRRCEGTPKFVPPSTEVLHPPNCRPSLSRPGICDIQSTFNNLLKLVGFMVGTLPHLPLLETCGNSLESIIPKQWSFLVYPISSPRNQISTHWPSVKASCRQSLVTTKLSKQMPGRIAFLGYATDEFITVADARLNGGGAVMYVCTEQGFLSKESFKLGCRTDRGD